MRFEDSQKAFPWPENTTRPNFCGWFGWVETSSNTDGETNRNDETDDFRVRHRAWFDDFEEGMPWELTLVGRQADVVVFTVEEGAI